MSTDIDIARKADIKPILKIAKKVGIPESGIMPFGKHKAKLEQSFLDSIQGNQDGKLILVTAITPTPAGEGKTTTTVGLTDGLNAIGKKAISCLREPSLGPCFGMKGGAAGGGYAQIIPMEDINLHFTGDFHAIGIAHNLLSALLDNSLYWGNPLNLNSRTLEWKRVVDMNDRVLREVVTSLGKGNGDPRENGFDITVASEVMAIFCLAKDFNDLRNRLGKITIGFDKEKKRIFAKDLKADGAMTVLLKDAFLPNLVQSLENNPSIVHGGPFANIAHGCNSIVATKTGLKLADYVVTEAGFGSDLGAEKFLDIKCQKAGLKPKTVVLVATVKALKMHGGVAKSDLGDENVKAVRMGMVNLYRHIENLNKFNIPVIVAINHFTKDTDAEISTVIEGCKQYDVEAIVCKHWELGSKGIKELSEKVVELVDSNEKEYSPIYDENMSLITKIEKVCQEIYRATNVHFSSSVRAKIEKYQNEGFGKYQICMAKTQYSFSDDPSKYGAPENHEITVKDVILNTGAEFLVVLAGDIMRMPGLPKVPAANFIEIDQDGFIQGLF